MRKLLKVNKIMIPFTFGKTITIPIQASAARESTVHTVVNALIKRIQEEKPGNCTNHDSHVAFSGGAFSVPQPRWNIFGPITRGEIDVITTEHGIVIAYKLWYTELLILVSGLTVLIALISPSLGFTLQDFWAVGIGWLWLYLGNYLISIARFHRLMSSVAKELELVLNEREAKP